MGLSVAGSGSPSQGQPDPMTQTAHEAVESKRSIRAAPWRGEGSKGQVICPEYCAAVLSRIVEILASSLV